MTHSDNSRIRQLFIGERTICTVQFILILLSALAILKSIFVSFDIDEGYAVAQAYRLIKGDKLIQDMWEPHQSSAFFSAILMLPFLALTAGDTTGIIVYLRIIGSVIHLIIGILLYRTARKQFGANISLLIALIHINFLPKWISAPEFEIMHYWSLCTLFLSLHSWIRNPKKKSYLIISAIALGIAIMSYPTMIILYPPYIAAIVIFSKKGLSH